jgi:hypothetical protein
MPHGFLFAAYPSVLCRVGSVHGNKALKKVCYVCRRCEIYLMGDCLLCDLLYLCFTKRDMRFETDKMLGNDLLMKYTTLAQ